MFQDVMETQPASVDQTHINILAELYMQQGEYGSVAGIIQRAVALAPDQELPIDLQVSLLTPLEDCDSLLRCAAG